MSKQVKLTSRQLSRGGKMIVKQECGLLVAYLAIYLAREHTKRTTIKALLWPVDISSSLPVCRCSETCLALDIGHHSTQWPQSQQQGLHPLNQGKPSTLVICTFLLNLQFMCLLDLKTCVTQFSSTLFSFFDIWVVFSSKLMSQASHQPTGKCPDVPAAQSAPGLNSEFYVTVTQETLL